MTTSTISSVLDRRSRYVQGGLTEVGDTGLEWWDSYTFPTDPSDQMYIIEDKYNHRIDLIANAFYDDWSLWWFIAQYNNILDPYREIRTGAVLYIPDLSRIQLLMNQTTGGTASTRQDQNLLPPVVL